MINQPIGDFETSDTPSLGEAITNQDMAYEQDPYEQTWFCCLIALVVSSIITCMVVGLYVFALDGALAPALLHIAQLKSLLIYILLIPFIYTSIFIIWASFKPVIQNLAIRRRWVEQCLNYTYFSYFPHLLVVVMVAIELFLMFIIAAAIYGQI